MENPAYCSMIHGGMILDFEPAMPHAGPCCLRGSRSPVDTKMDFWNNENFVKLREINKTGSWDSGCANCNILEKAGHESMRTGMNRGLQLHGQTELSGPVRIDLSFDISCNLACRSCNTESSTFWQKHLKEHGEWPYPVFTPKHKNNIIEALQSLDLSNLQQLVFCGGETLLGQEYWDVARWLGDNVPNAKQQLTLCFQTNGTQEILERNYEIIEKFHLVKLHISLDGVGERFEYLRWPADWNQVTNNILSMKKHLPGNVMFLIEETISIFNLFYLDELDQWVKTNFSTNREGDVINHTQHLANGVFNLKNLSQEYRDAVLTTRWSKLVNPNQAENASAIQEMLAEIRKFDRYRNQSFEQTFPEISKFYSKF